MFVLHRVHLTKVLCVNVLSKRNQMEEQKIPRKMWMTSELTKPFQDDSLAYIRLELKNVKHFNAISVRN